MNQPVIVDARGLACPIPVVRAKKALDAIDHGRVIVLVDEQAALENVVRLAAHLGCSSQRVACEGGFRITIDKCATGAETP
jgi:TusA-related sulfurtransferase